MKIVKVLIVCLLIVGGVFAFLGFILGGGSKPVNPPINRGGETQAESVNLDASEGAAIFEYVAAFSNGWDDVAYSNAKSYIDQPQRTSNRIQLMDALTGGILVKLDSIITAVYSSNPPRRPLSAHAVLGPAYRGLDSIANDSPVVRDNRAYARLTEDRDVYNGVYTFGNSTFDKQPAYKLKLVPVSGGYSLDWNERLEDFAAHRARHESRRQNLQARLDRCDDLRGVRWFADALSSQRFNEKITTAESNYKNNERAELIRALRAISNDPRVCDNAATASAVAAQMTAAESNLPSFMYSAEVGAAFRSARQRLTSPSPITR